MKSISLLLIFGIVLSSYVPCEHVDPVGFEIHGDFNGDKIEDAAKSGTIRQFHFDRIKETDWMIHFSDSTIPELMIGCCLTYLITEGDLDNDRKDEISIYQRSNASENCAYYITTFTLKKNKWEILVNPFPVAEGCDGFTQQYLLDKVFTEAKGKIFYTVDTGKTIQKIKVL
jgi:hypothetical protein